MIQSGMDQKVQVSQLTPAVNCQALEHEDVDGICEHLDVLEEESVSPIKLVKVIRGCGHRFKPTTHKCGSKYDKSIDMCLLLLCTSL